MLTETRLTIETPEGAELPLAPAGIGVRIGAFATDFFIKALVIILLLIISAFLGKAGYGVYLIAYFLLEWFYPVLFEVLNHGQTPGKKRTGIAVVNDDGTPVTFAASLIRNLLRVVDFLPFAYVVGIVCSVFNRQFKRVGDLAAGTMVVHKPKKLEKPVVDVEGYESLPSDFNLDEQRAVLEFAERCPQLSHERQAELAQLLAPVLGKGDQVTKLKRMANSLLGVK